MRLRFATLSLLLLLAFCKIASAQNDTLPERKGFIGITTGPAFPLESLTEHSMYESAKTKKGLYAVPMYSIVLQTLLPA